MNKKENIISFLKYVDEEMKLNYGDVVISQESYEILYLYIFYLECK